jgi:hypothetical protein
MIWSNLPAILGVVSALFGSVALILKHQNERDRDVWQRMKDCYEAELARLRTIVEDREEELARMRSLNPEQRIHS